MPRSLLIGPTWFRGFERSWIGLDSTRSISEHCGVNEKAKLSFGVMDGPG